MCVCVCVCVCVEEEGEEEEDKYEVPNGLWTQSISQLIKNFGE